VAAGPGPNGPVAAEGAAPAPAARWPGTLHQRTVRRGRRSARGRGADWRPRGGVPDAAGGPVPAAGADRGRRDGRGLAGACAGPGSVTHSGHTRGEDQSTCTPAPAGSHAAWPPGRTAAPESGTPRWFTQW